MIFLSGCTSTYFTGYNPQSHFDYPNSNVLPMGKVVGEATTTSIFTPPYVDSDLTEQAIQNALQQKPGSDLLINYLTFQKRMDILFIHSLTLRVEGTAAKMEIGTQKLF